jgi:hypothetical protein
MSRTYRVGSEPPQVIWTIVRGDTGSFRVYVTDDSKDPLNISDWNIRIDFKRFGQEIFTLYRSMGRVLVMSKAVISDISDFKTKKIYQVEKTSSRIFSKKDYSSKIEYSLPFRIRLSSVGIEGYGPNNPAPIGIAVIGLNNYIL